MLHGAALPSCCRCGQQGISKQKTLATLAFEQKKAVLLTHSSRQYKARRTLNLSIRLLGPTLLTFYLHNYPNGALTFTQHSLSVSGLVVLQKLLLYFLLITILYKHYPSSLSNSPGTFHALPASSSTDSAMVTRLVQPCSLYSNLSEHHLPP